MNIQIRKAEGADVPALVDILRSLDIFPHIVAETYQTTKDRVNRHLSLCISNDGHLILIAQDSLSGEIVGYTAVHWIPYLILAGPEGYVSELFIKQDFRGHGIGTRLIDAAKIEDPEPGMLPVNAAQSSKA